MNWERADYPVAEGLVLRLCATALQPTARQFVVDVIAPISEGMFDDIIVELMPFATLSPL